jgi:hypothetical protein
MVKPDAVFVYIGTYPDEAAARADYDIVRDLHAAGAVGTYDASVVTKDNAGKVHVNKDETATRHGAWGGAAAGALVGILFPPSIIVSAAVGAAVGGVGGHLWRGMSRGRPGSRHRSQLTRRPRARGWLSCAAGPGTREYLSGEAPKERARCRSGTSRRWARRA